MQAERRSPIIFQRPAHLTSTAGTYTEGATIKLPLALTLIGAALTMAGPGQGRRSGPAAGPLRHLRRGGQPLRGRAPRHHARAVRLLQRPALPGQAPVGRQDPGHRSSSHPRSDAGGYANAAAQDAFCANTICVINVIYDQSGKGNHLYQAPPGHLQGPGEGRIRHPAHRRHGADYDRRPQGLRRLHHAGHGVPQQQRHRPRDQRRAGGHVLRRGRQALRQRLLL